MIYFQRLAFILTLLLLLNSCNALFGREGFFRDREDDYLIAQEIPPMKVPQGLDTSALSELFVVPPVASEYIDPDTEFKVPRPAVIGEGKKAEVKIQKLGKRRWVVINSAPGHVWPRVKQFLTDNNINIYAEDPVAGEIETVWLKLAEEPEFKDRYLIRVLPGLHPNSTEVSITQITVDANTPGAGSVNWPEFSVSAEREKWMLDKLAGELAVPQEASVSLLAQSIGGVRRVEVVRPDQGEMFILMNIDYERAWASVSGALDQDEFELISQNRTQGYFTAAFDSEFLQSEQDKEPGFFGKLFGFDTKKKRQVEARKVTYQLFLYQFDQQDVRVFCRDQQGKMLPALEAERILHKVRSYLL